MAIRLNLTNQSQSTDPTVRSVATDVASGLQGLSVADAQLLAHAKAMGIDVEKMPIEDIRRRGIAGLSALKQEQELAKQVASLRGDLSVSTSAALAGLSTAANIASVVNSFDAATVFGSPADVLLFAAAEAIGIDVDKVRIEDLRGLDTGGLCALRSEQDRAKQIEQMQTYAADAHQLSKARAIGIDVDKVSIEDLRGLGTEGLFALKQRQDLLGSLFAPAGAASAFADVSKASAIASMDDALEAAIGLKARVADEYLLSEARAIGIDVDKVSIEDLRGLGTEGLFALKQRQDLLGSLFAPAGAASAFADVSKASAIASIGDVFGTFSDASVSDAIAAISRHGSALESAWMASHRGGLDQYVKELARLVSPLASIREVIGTAGGVLGDQFYRLAGNSACLQVSGFAADALLVSAWKPENLDVPPAVIAERFMRDGAAIPNQVELTQICHSVLPYVHLPDRRSERLENELQRERERRVEAEDGKDRAEALLAKALAVIETFSNLHAVQAGAEVVQTEKTPATPSNAIPAPDFAKLATREALIEAFGKFTEMNASWFVKLGDTPALLAARKVTGQGGRNNAAPLFCPFEVMQWLINPNRRKGNPMQPDTGWRMLELHFPLVYHAHSVCDPRQD